MTARAFLASNAMTSGMSGTDSMAAFKQPRRRDAFQAPDRRAGKAGSLGLGQQQGVTVIKCAARLVGRDPWRVDVVGQSDAAAGRIRRPFIKTYIDTDN
jgi:hypothetical protein